MNDNRCVISAFLFFCLGIIMGVQLMHEAYPHKTIIKHDTIKIVGIKDTTFICTQDNPDIRYIHRRIDSLERLLGEVK